jgi:hypothetical protein
MEILFVADVFGRPGRTAMAEGVARWRASRAPALTIVNGENAAGGFGLTPSVALELFDAGADVVTSGNHIWDKREIYSMLDQEPRLLRPDNYPAGNPGRGVWVGIAEGVTVAVLNLQGRVFMKEIDCPFRRLDTLLLEGPVAGARIRFVDFHAEATAEKLAFGRYADGRVTAVIGTHTHVPSADARLLRQGTAYVTDAGMTGPHDGVIGVEAKGAIERFLNQTPTRFQVAGGDVRFQGIVVTADPQTGRATAIERIDESCAKRA